MKKVMTLLLAICLLAIFCVQPFAADISTEEMEEVELDFEFVDNEVIVMTDYYVAPENYNSKVSVFHGVPITDIEPLFDNSTQADIENYTVRSGSCFPYVITTVNGVNIDEAVETLTKDSQIIAADKNFIYQLENPEYETTPIEDDVSIVLNEVPWQQDDIGLESAWNKTFVGSDDVVVAVMDSGFNLTHPDIQTFDATNAYNATTQTSNVTPDFPNDLTKISTNHGTFVSGIIGATYENGIGLNGVCQDVTILPIKVPEFNDQTQSLSEAQLSSAFSYAISNNASVVNCSFSFNHAITSTLSAAITSAKILVVVAAGNDGLITGEGKIGYDMAYVLGCSWARNNNPYIIVVGASDSTNEKCDFSNYSNLYCDLFAPGVDVYSTKYSGYGTGSGTSFAAPYVAGACALIMSKATHLTPLGVKNYILSNVTPVSGLANYCLYDGILSIGNAVEAVYNQSRGAYSKGDVDGNGFITSADYTLCQQIFNGTYSGTPTAAQLDACDVNDNGSVDARDYLLLKRYVNRTYYFIP